MNREEAIKILKAKIDTMEDGAICCNYGNDKEVFEMAIKALEQEPCADAISRKAALDMATTIQTDDYSGNEIMEVVDIDEIKALPPVTPTRKWIPISEGLPKVTGWYYVTFETYSGGYMVREMFYIKSKNYWTDTNANTRKVLSNDDVVAWMPSWMPETDWRPEPELYNAESV